MSGTPIYGLDRELAAKAAAKHDPVREQEAREWIESFVGEAFPSEGFQESLKDGVILCKLINALTPDTPVKFNTSKMPFKQMENINTFLQSLTTTFSVPPHDQFQTIDLYENKNPTQVVDTIFALSRHAGQKGLIPPEKVLGPRLAEKRTVDFSDEILNQGKTVIGLQMGYAGGANASGVSYGARREIGGADLGRQG
ncbi:calponin domain-containing protein [Fimicolochytrium jonesii]|uniref:calponin domain-containing protein n=1 Tax=Fimicolochytrium jonesii TaxID=1396493 RepID=UPI0022FE3335|nr:calponin domain-containing protein [Fimicolochytrium jonesii]KAI8816274.1 calponin homology domain-containing protein [Fimicolochytrium jonesii]